MLSLRSLSRHLHSLRLAAAALCLGLASISGASAADNIPALVDEGISQILTNEATGRMARFLESGRITGLESVTAAGAFRSLTSENLKQQMTRSLERRGIAVDGSSQMKLQSTLIVSETQENVIVVLKCTLRETGGVEVCTVQIRKVLPAASAN